ncbi:MAG: sugar metabolism transcriptional regulator [Hyphomicrobiales bacterium]|nr:MAG: sugar metabolism transcriptional regulator [Hyphomicrobiales bacterium]
MLISDIRSYIADAGRVSVSSIAARFDIEPDALKGILDTLAAKGTIRPVGEPQSACSTGSGCNSGGCGCCSYGVEEIYEWVGRRRDRA